MFKRDAKQKIYLSFIPVHRIRAVIADPSHSVFDKVMVVEDHHVKVIGEKIYDDKPFYQQLREHGYSNERIIQMFEQAHDDYNSHFRDAVGMPLEEYEKNIYNVKSA